MYKVIDFINYSIEYFNDLISAKTWVEFLIIQKNDKNIPINLIITNETNGTFKTYQFDNKKQIKSYDIDLSIDNKQSMFKYHDLLCDKYIKSKAV